MDNAYSSLLFSTNIEAIARRDKLSLDKMNKKTHHSLMETERIVTLNDCQAHVKLSRRKGVKRITLRYNPRTKQFKLTMPPRCSDRKADSFLKSQQLWMMTSLNNHSHATSLTFGATIPVLGEERIISRDGAEEGELTILATDAKCEEVTITTLKHMLHDYIDHKAQYYAKALNVTIERITIRDTSSRWGSCSVDGKLNFSWRLVFAPREVLDYVIAHEVAHLIEMNHSAAFWSIVESIDSDYKTNRKWLRQNGETLFRYGS